MPRDGTTCFYGSCRTFTQSVDDMFYSFCRTRCGPCHSTRAGLPYRLRGGHAARPVAVTGSTACERPGMIPMSLLQTGAPLTLAAHGCSEHITYAEAGIVGLIQGVTELFPVSSLGHNVLLPALVGGCWAKDLNVAADESPYLAFIVGLHVATAIALLIYFWRDWVRIIKGFFSSLRQIARPAEGTTRWMLQSPDEQLAWLIILATIPVGLAGLAFEHVFRVIFGRPAYAAVFLIINGLILLAGERFRRRASLQADEQIAAEREYALAGAGGGYAGSYPGRARHAASRRDLRLEETNDAFESDERLSKM